MARRFADACVNIARAYPTFCEDARLVIATDDLEAARAALE
jgi:hypothetical protein